jgi:oligogalacturonide lyase
MARLTLSSLAALSLIASPFLTQAQSNSPTKELPPKTWVDKDTGHRVWRISDEPNSGAFYFNVNAYTPDHKQMVYNSPQGICVLDLATMRTKMLVPNVPPPPGVSESPSALFARGARSIVVGHKTNSIFFTLTNRATHTNAIYKANTNTGEIRKLVDLPGRLSVSSINADESLGAGTYNEADVPGGDPNAPNAFVNNPPPVPPPANANAAFNLGGAHIQADDKGQMMERRLAARIPLVLFTIRLEPGPNGEKPGLIKPLLHSTDWVNHLLFSPTDPKLLMYCHEGMWQKVDRIWLIHTDGTHNTLIHKRTMAMEIAGHEFWGLDGQTIWYDWQYPKGEDFFLASYNLQTGKRTAYHMQRNEWSIHFNLTQDLDVFTGDGGDSGQVAQAPDGEWIELFYPKVIGNFEGALNEPTFWQPGVFKSERLVNMSHHNYRAEPNVRFSPDKKYVFFTSNMFGSSYIFGVEVQKSDNPPAADIQSTPELARKYNPVEPTPTTTPK